MLIFLCIDINIYFCINRPLDGIEFSYLIRRGRGRGGFMLEIVSWKRKERQRVSKIILIYYIGCENSKFSLI